ncbi:MAG: hypothetical protein ACRD02_13935 [Acidimicrobiia bacterium]
MRWDTVADVIGLVNWRELRRRALLVAAGGYATVALLAPLLILAPLLTTSSQRGLLPATQDLCSQLGPDAAVLLLGDDSFPRVYGQPLRGLCGVPVAIAPGGIGGADLEELARSWEASGHRLVVLASQPGTINGYALEVLVETELERLERTIERRPAVSEVDHLRVTGTPIEPEEP